MANRKQYAILAGELMSRARRQGTLLIGIDGAGGSGKSTFAESLKAALHHYTPNVTILHMDDFFRRASRQSTEFGDHFVDGRIECDEIHDLVLVPLSRNQPGQYQRYDWITHALEEWHDVPVGGVVIVEGVRALHQTLVPFYDYRVWVECPRHIRLDRGIQRDGPEARMRWETIWMPAEDEYIEENCPQDAADLIVDGSGETSVDLSKTLVAMDG